jgi:hypothetical protein
VAALVALLVAAVLAEEVAEAAAVAQRPLRVRLQLSPARLVLERYRRVLLIRRVRLA